MQPKKLLIDYIKKQAGGSDHDDAPWLELFDGMSTGTARIVIERHTGDQLPDGQNLDLQNQGRYYIAKIINYKGVILQRFLIDKQTGLVKHLH